MSHFANCIITNSFIQKHPFIFLLVPNAIIKNTPLNSSSTIGINVSIDRDKCMLSNQSKFVILLLDESDSMAESIGSASSMLWINKMITRSLSGLIAFARVSIS